MAARAATAVPRDQSARSLRRRGRTPPVRQTRSLRRRRRRHRYPAGPRIPRRTAKLNSTVTALARPLLLQAASPVSAAPNSLFTALMAILPLNVWAHDFRRSHYLIGTRSGQVREQGVEGKFLLDADIVARHGGRQTRIPGGGDRLAGQPGQPRGGPQSQHCRCRGLISVPVVPPRLPVRLSLVHSLTNRAGNPDPAPVEIAVVTELCAARRQEAKQLPSGGGWLAADADQRRAAAAKLVRGSRDHHGIFADPHESHW